MASIDNATVDLDNVDLALNWIVQEETPLFLYDDSINLDAKEAQGIGDSSTSWLLVTCTSRLQCHFESFLVSLNMSYCTSDILEIYFYSALYWHRRI